MALNQLHDHELPAEWKILPNVVRDCGIAPKEVQE